MDKKLTIGTQLDTSSFDQSVASLQKKLEVLRASAATTQRVEQSGVSGLSTEAFKKEGSNTQKELEKSLKEQVVNQEKLTKEIVKRSSELKRHLDTQKELVKGSQEELSLKEKIAKHEANTQQMRKQFATNNAAINKTLDMRDDDRLNKQNMMNNAQKAWAESVSKAETPSGGGPKKPGMLGGIGDAISRAGGIGMSIGELGGIAIAVAGIIDKSSGIQMRIEQARGTAISQTTGKDLERIYSGKSAFEMGYAPERAQAKGIAKDKAEEQKTADLWKAAGAAALLVGGVAATVMSGGLAGVAIGAAGAIGGASMFAGMDKMRESVLSKFGGKFGEEHKEKYDALVKAQQGTDFRETLANLKAQDPAKQQALERFEQNYEQNLKTQRTLGISTQQMYGEGGLQQRGAQAGFMPEQIAGMAQSIVGAGGSARMGRQAQFGLQMERQGLTNAPQLLGTLSGGIQDPNAGKRAMIGILSEAFQIGLDNTDFAEEQRRFSQATSQVMARVGATSESAQNRVSETMGQFVGQRTNVGIEQAKSAYEKFQERGSQTSGRRGAVRMMDALQDPDLKNIPVNELSELLSMRPEELNAESPTVQYLASQAGISPDKLIEKVGKGSKKSRFLIPGSQEKMKGLSESVNKWIKANPAIGASGLDEAIKNYQVPPEVVKAVGQMDLLIQQEEGGGITQAGMAAKRGEFLEKGKLTPAMKAAEGAKLEETGGRIEDQMMSGSAKAADALRVEFEKLIPVLQQATGGISKFAGETVTAADKASQDAEARRRVGTGGSTDFWNSVLRGTEVPASNQQQGGSTQK